MPMRIMSLLWLLATIQAVATVHAGDEAALLAFKGQLRDGGVGALASWNSSTDFCSWEGVACSQRRPARVVALTLDGRALTGELSPALGNLTFLQTIDLSFNWLHGEIPSSLGRLRRLQKLKLNDNSLSGMFPVNLTSCVSLVEMGLHNNKLGGRIPDELGEKLMSLAGMSLGNNSFTGPIPASLANLSHLETLELYNNQLVGSISPGLGSISSMRQFILFGNYISGMIPPSLYNWSSLELLEVGVNRLYGSIPDDISNKYPKMKGLGLADNQFTGTIPSSISNLTYLEGLYLPKNSFSGYVPPTLGRLVALKYVSLAENKLEVNDNKGWEFITSLANCTQLEQLALGGDSFGGQLPVSIVNLSTTLQQLHIMHNRVSGSIPGLSWYLDLSYNSLSGPLPDEVGSLANLNQLILSGTVVSVTEEY